MNELLDKCKDAETSLDDLGEVDYSAWENRLKDIDMDKVIRVKKPGLSLDLDNKFWQYGLYSKDFCEQLIGWIKAMMVKYACPELKYDEDLPYQVLQQINKAVNGYYDPYKANIVTFMHRVLYNHISLRGYHANKYKDGKFYQKYSAYDKIVRGITRSRSIDDCLLLDNAIDNLENIVVNDNTREYIKNIVLYSYPKDNVIFKMLTWELNHPHNN